MPVTVSVEVQLRIIFIKFAKKRMKKHIVSLIMLCTVLSIKAENKVFLKTEGKNTYTFINESSVSFKKSRPVKQTQTIKYDLTANATGAGKGVELTIRSIRCEKKQKDSTTVLSTEKPRLPLSYIMRQATNRVIKVELGEKNLTSGVVSGIDTINAHLFDDYVTPPDSINRIAYQYLMNEEYGKNLVRSLTENAVSIAPDSVLKDNGTWTKATCLYGTFTSNKGTTYTLKGKKGSTYIISGTNQIDKTKPCRFSIAGKAYSLEEVDGQIVSDIMLDCETGLLTNSTTTISIKAKATPLSMNETTDESISDEIVLNIKQTIAKE